MLVRVKTLLVAVLVTACHHEAPPAAPAPPPGLACAKVAEHLVATLPPHDPPPTLELTDKITGVISQRCEADAWTEEAKRCLNLAASVADAQTRCQLTPTQLDNVNRQMATTFGAPN